MATLDLATAAQELRDRFGARLEAPYVPGKTMFRDALCERHDISQAEAEVLCDSLERAGAIRYERSEISGERWTLTPDESAASS